MAGHTVVGLFDSYAQAEGAVSRLVGTGIGREQVDIANNDGAGGGSTAAPPSTTRTPSRDDDRSIGDRISDFFSRLFGDRDDDDDARTYAEAVRRGGAVVTVRAPTEAEADRAADILESCGAVDVDERTSQWRDGGWTGGVSAAPRAAERQGTDGTDPRVIPVVDEELKIGKRRRDRGGVRIYAHLEEHPVAEQVRLREEHAHVERRPADRAATEADFAAFKEGTIEVRESVEEPVVAKTARVVEEVVIAKETTERVETVNDVVRRGEVDVEQVDATRGRDAATASGRPRHDEYDTDYRSHWQSNYGAAGGSYEDYRPAYEYGSKLASDDRFRGRDWSEVERDARTDWERRYPNRPWERMKAAVAHGRDRVPSRR